MNERIRELAQRAGFNYVYSKDILYLEGLNPSCAEEVSDLVELIVRECAMLCRQESENKFNNVWEQVRAKCDAQMILEHFGVEE